MITYLSLGSNLGDREGNIRRCIERLNEAGKLCAISSLYETEPVEVIDQPEFLNCAVALKTNLTPQTLLQKFLQIERDMGRVRGRDKGPRVIDIDILLYADSIVESDTLVVPHPSMAQRRFVLVPLAEIAAETIHPIFKRPVKDLLVKLPDGQAVRRLNVGLMAE